MEQERASQRQKNWDEVDVASLPNRQFIYTATFTKQGKYLACDNESSCSSVPNFTLISASRRTGDETPQMSPLFLNSTLCNGVV